MRGLQARHYFGVGLRWHNQQREDLALPYYEKALAADARASEMWNNYGQTLHALGRYDEALAAYASSIKAAPDDASAHFHHAMQQMAMGDDAAGWKNYAWRFKAVTGLKYVREDMPVWQGESLAGRRSRPRRSTRRRARADHHRPAPGPARLSHRRCYC
ncbi:MAG: tetratricopeptide repeat protein [Alphaproteobacteria bacterium]|nr:tetratricopeptide repeat protein [Alphaproteobacteria bacterium]